MQYPQPHIELEQTRSGVCVCVEPRQKMPLPQSAKPVRPVTGGVGPAGGSGVGGAGVGLGHDPPELSAWHLVALFGNQ